MDLLDKVMSSMGPVPKKPKSEPKPQVAKVPGAASTSAVPGTSSSGSFRIPKKTRPPEGTAQPPTNTQPARGGAAPQYGHNNNLQPQGAPRGGAAGDGRNNWGRQGGQQQPQFRGMDKGQGGYGGAGVKREYGGGNPGYGRQQAQSSGAMDIGEGFVAPDTLEVSLNALSLENRGSHEYVDRYHIKILYVKKTGQEKDATMGPKNDLAKQYRSEALFSIMNTLYRKHPERYGQDKYSHVYDGGYTLYSIGCNIKPEEGEIEYKWDKSEMDSLLDSKTRLHFKTAQSLIITVQHTNKLYIKGELMSTQAEDMQREVVKFYECLTSQILHNGEHLTYATKAFEKYKEPLRNQDDIGEGKCVKTGLDKNVRLLGDSTNNAKLYLQGSAKISAFHTAQKVLPYIRKVLNLQYHGRDEEGESRLAVNALINNPGLKKQVNRALKNVAVSTTHMNNPHTFFIKNITDMTARTYKFPMDGREVSVYEYFQEKHKRRLMFPDCPLALERRPGSVCYHPLEVLEIQEGQRVETTALTGRLTDAMMKQARMLPHEAKQRMKTQLERAQLMKGHNKYMEAFGVETSDEFLNSLASVLCDPTLSFKSNINMNPDAKGVLSTRRPNRYQFLQPANVTSTITFIPFDRCMNEEQARRFWKDLVRHARNKGIQITEERVLFLSMSSEDPQQIERLFERCAAEKHAMIMFITKPKNDPVHRTMKLHEATHKVPTQNIALETVHKFGGDKGVVTVENILLKFNAKLGGVNHKVDAPTNAFAPKQDVRAKAKECFEDRMFVGLELSHAAAQCLFDRQAGIEVGEPTVVGMTWSLKYNTQLSGESWYQQSRLHNIKYLESRFVLALQEYHKATGKLPSQIVVYRAGASEGEFDEVRKEVELMRSACRACSNLTRSGSYKPAITLIVAMKNSNNILYRAHLPAPQGNYRPRPAEVNVPSGTCVDKAMTNPLFEEFIMTSQRANIGTSKPMRYTAVVNDAPLSLSEMKHLTHWMCYGHQVSTLPCHKPHVLYAAENLAKRGRENWLEHTHRNSDATSSGSGPRDIREGEDADAYFVRISKQLDNKLPGSFWA